MQSGFTRAATLCALLALGACVQNDTATDPAPRGKTEAAAKTAADPETAAPAAPETCVATDKTPARFETVTEQVLVSGAVTDAAGKVITPASYRSETRQRQITEGKSLRFDTPCAAELTPELIANLQRALTARALYSGAVDGRFSTKLRQSIRSYQQNAHGLDSAILSMQAARSLGLVAYDRKDF